MAFTVDINDAKKQFPNFTFVTPLTPSAQKAAFHVKDEHGKDLCLKIISPTCTSERLHREITAMQNISHPNVVSLLEYTFSSTPGSLKHFVVEEFVDGADLEVAPGTPWPRPRVAGLFAKLMDGLEQLNLQHIVHRDLKPSNIRVRPDDTPVLIDFGLARHLQMSDLTLTAQGAQLGTPLYFSPEQFEGTKREIDHRTDLFAAGVIIFQALVGRHPFATTNISRADLHGRVCNNQEFMQDADFVSLPRQWQLLVKKMLEKERGLRVNSAAQVATLLRKLENV